MKIQRLFISFMIGVGFIIGALWMLIRPATTLAGPATRPLAAMQHTFPGCGATIQVCIDGAAGDTILIQAGVYTESLILNKSVSLIGESRLSTIIRAPANQRVLAATGLTLTHTVVISGLTITGGNVATNGGGVLITGLTAPLFQNVIIADNGAGQQGGGIYDETGGRLIMTDVVFINNRASFDGGAVSAADTVVKGGRFENNRCGAFGCGGGGLIVDALSLNGTEFINNTAGFGGGALAFDAITVRGGRFEDNTATFQGGGLNAQKTLSLSGTAFINNTTQNGDGGGVAADQTVTVRGGRFEGNIANNGNGGGVAAGQAVTVRGGRFEGNIANNGYGGGLFGVGGLSVSETEFISNTASFHGGGVTVGGMMVMTGSRFENNRCLVDGCQGGALNGQGDLSMHNTEFISNTADFGGGIIVFGPTQITGGRFQRNTASIGAGLLIQSNPLTLHGTEFADNTASFSGGGVVINQGSAMMTAGRFERNMASVAGGGMIILGELILTDTDFISNTASFGGGVIADATTVTGGRFVQNVSSANRGGGLVVTGTLTLNDVEFIDNTAALEGGGVSVRQGTVNIAGTHFEGNRSKGSDGGGLHINEGVLTLKETDFIRNTANGSGGGVAAAVGMTRVTGGRFEQNVAGGDSGGLIAGGSLSLTGAHFIENRATFAGGGAGALGPMTMTGAYFERNTALQGGGLNAQVALTATNTTFISNTADFGGGAVTFQAATINNGRFEGNVAREGGGLSSGDRLSLVNSDFINNEAEFNGGGVNARTVIVTGGRFEGNVTANNGGGLAAAEATITEAEFIKNVADFKGGGVFVTGTVTINGGYFEQNRCTRLLLACSGGGLATEGALSLDATKFINNSAALGGGLVHHGDETARIVNVLLAGNTAQDAGAGLQLASSGRAVVLHTTIAADTSNPSPAVVIENGVVGVTNTLIAGHAVGLAQTGGTVFEDYNLYFRTGVDKSGAVTSGGHSLNGDPNFVDPANNDYQLGSDSAALDRGIDAGVLVDIEGVTRPQGDGFDIGAYEGAVEIPPGSNIYLPFILK